MKNLTLKTLNQFKAYLIEEEKSEHTIEKYTRDILFFLKWLNGKETDKKTLIEYKKYLCENYAPKSVNSMLSSLNAIFIYLNRYDLKIKTLKIQRSVFCEQEKELTKNEYERLLYCAQNRNNLKLYYLMQTIASTGIRVSELEFITANAVFSGSATIYCKGKLRKVLLPSQLCRMLKSYIKSENIKSGPVFVSKNGKPLNRSNIWKMLKNLCKEAGVSDKKVFPHNFRHLFARTFYSLQKDIVRLADILGHSNINTTRIYTTETGEVHARQLQQLGLLRC